MSVVGRGLMIMEDDHNDSSSSLDHSSDGSSSSLDVADDASSFPFSGHVFEFSELMAHLPIKRGLSKFYQGKCQSFTSLSRVKTIQDLGKKEKPCKSYGGGLDTHKRCSLFKPSISKKMSISSGSEWKKHCASSFPSFFTRHSS